MHERFHDAMATVQQQGKPSLFITMTCNPYWPEITRELEPSQQPQDRPDVLARVFNLKLQALLKDLNTKNIFGKVIGALHVVEFQKGRCLPHAHILLIMDPEDHLRTPEDIDGFISAELPIEPMRAAFQTDEAYDDAHLRYTNLSTLVAEYMAHDLCGDGHENTARCMKDGKCTKSFPKDYQQETYLNENDQAIYPLYRRRNRKHGGATFTHKGRILDNRWIVPYSPFLLLKYECHINVEACVSVQAVKYLYKYVYKGPDRAMVGIQVTNGPAQPGTVQRRDEIQEFQDVRSFGGSEA
jgi:hypothetical protein